MQYKKMKSVSKVINTKGPKLEGVISKTLETCAEIVGSTLGPGGMSVLIERQENMPPLLTKDGVTVFRSLGFQDPTAQTVLETARDAAVHTATEAGDGTTTSTILANAFYKAVSKYCKDNPKVSPQRVVRALEKAFKTTIEPSIAAWKTKVKFDAEGKKHLKAVAKVSANGDEALADAVLECFELVGDDGNVTLLEFNGPSRYEVERLDGYGVGTGFEDCCGPFYQKFLNEAKTQSCLMENPVFILYHGRISDVGLIAPIFEKIVDGAAGKVPNVVLVATGFSEMVLGQLAINFSAANHQLAVYPLLVPMSPIKSGQLDFIADLSALTGGKILDPMNAPLDRAEIADLGTAKTFEATRFRSNIIVDMFVGDTEARVIERADNVNEQLKSIATSDLEKSYLRERIGKLTGGIAKLKIIGSSSGELREKRDRAEDAVCAVRGAIAHGVLPAGGWTLLRLVDLCSKSTDYVLRDIVATALLAPVQLLYKNAGFTQDEADIQAFALLQKAALGEPVTFDLLEGTMVDAFKAGLLDSAPAVLEAIRNSISIAALLGTTGGTVVFPRDNEYENIETRDHNRFMKDLES